MLARTCRIIAAVAAASLALLGIVLFPGLLLVWALVAVLIGTIAATWSHVLQPEAGTAVRVGAVVATAVTVLGLAIAGSIVLIALGTVWVVPLLLGLSGLLGWRHRRAWTVALSGLVRPTLTAAPPTTPPYTRRPTHGHSTDPLHGATRGELARAVPPLLARLPSLAPGALSTLQLCGAWQHSYWLLLDLPPGPSHDEIVRIRHHVLDELERRDPTGFSRWLQTGPRASSHPGRFLVADN